MRYIIKLIKADRNEMGNDFYISPEQFEKICVVLKNPPKFLEIEGRVINTNQITGIFPDNLSDGYKESRPRLPEPKPTLEAIENRNRIIKATKEKMGWDQPDDENLCGKPHNNGEGEESCSECLTIKMGI